MNIEQLGSKARWLRKEVLKTIFAAKGGHIGGTFSCIELLVSLYYRPILRVYPESPRHRNRDRFLCKGQASIALYSIWCDLGLLQESRLLEYGKNGSSLGSEINIDTPGGEYNTGSLGNLLGVGAGVALAGKLNNESYRTIVLMGDGECDEGSVWESAMFASRHELTNLVGIVDRNRLAVTDFIEEDKSGTLESKFAACGWRSLVINGHSFEEIFEAFSHADHSDQPLMIVADTIKGKGVSFMENGVKWHHSVPTDVEFEVAMRELDSVL